MVMPRVEVNTPPVAPLPFGLLSAAAAVLTDADPHWEAGGVSYQPEHCGVAQAAAVACVTPRTTLTETDGLPLTTADPFVVYHLFKCRMPGGGLAAGRTRAQDALRLGEQRGAEAGLAAQLPLRSAVDKTPTPGTAVHPVLGLAILEGWAAANYGGTPTFHVPRSMNTILSALGATERQGLQFQTKQGAPVAAGGGYEGAALKGPPTNPADPATVQTAGVGKAWLYVTGQVIVHRSDTISVAPTPRMDAPSNEFRALAERVYAVTTECIVGAVLVTTSYQVPA